jgi:hypothetical protein
MKLVGCTLDCRVSDGGKPSFLPRRGSEVGNENENGSRYSVDGSWCDMAEYAYFPSVRI